MRLLIIPLRGRTQVSGWFKGRIQKKLTELEKPNSKYKQRRYPRRCGELLPNNLC
jgi:hypothetical protein